MSDELKWTPARFWKDKWIEYLIGVWNNPEAHAKLWRKCGAANPEVYSEQIAANRRLIAAAPELFEALEQAHCYLFDDDGPDEVDRGLLATEIEAALKKARGEA